MKKYFIRGKVLLGAAMVAGLLVSGCGDSDNFVFTNTVAAPVPAAPVAVDDAFNSLGNATVTYAATGVLTNDTVNGANISAFDATGSNGGTVVLNADGSFSYTPVFGFVGAETFTYTLSNADGDSTATVTMTSTGQGFFVDNQAGATGNGSQADPFDALTDAIAVAGNGDTIFVSRGDGTNTGLSDDVTLPQGVSLIGEGLGLILAQTIVPQGQAPVINATVTVSDDNTISGFTFEDNSDDAIFGDGFTNVTITNNTFTGESTYQVNLDDVLGAITITNNTFSMDADADATEIDTAAAGTCTFVLNNNTFELLNPTADADDCFQVEVDGTTVATIQMNDNVFTGSTTATNSSLERGLHLETDEDSQTTLTASGNMFIFMDEPALVLDVDEQSTLTATITGNVLDQNLDSGEPDVEIDTSASSSATVVFDNNSLTNSADNGIAVLAGFTSTLNLALRNNTITGTVNEAVDIQASASSNLCAEITGNTFGADLEFRDNTSGNFNVEQFGNAMGDVLETLNTFTSGGVVVTLGTVTSVADGACAIP
jgi:hypothetical protein